MTEIQPTPAIVLDEQSRITQNTLESLYERVIPALDEALPVGLDALLTKASNHSPKLMNELKQTANSIVWRTAAQVLSIWIVEATIDKKSGEIRADAPWLVERKARDANDLAAQSGLDRDRILPALDATIAAFREWLVGKPRVFYFDHQCKMILCKARSDQFFVKDFP